MVKHTRSNLLCPYCDYQHGDPIEYRWHLYKKHNDSSAGKLTIHKCEKCDYETHR